MERVFTITGYRPGTNEAASEVVQMLEQTLGNTPISSLVKDEVIIKAAITTFTKEAFDQQEEAVREAFQKLGWIWVAVRSSPAWDEAVR